MKVLLVGAFASSGLPFLRELVKTPCEFEAFSNGVDDVRLLDAIQETDIVVGAPFTRAMAERSGKLRLIQNTGAGIDRFDLSNIPRGIPLAVVFRHEHAMAEHVLMTMLVLTRNLLKLDSQLRKDSWEESCVYDTFRSVGELRGKTVGIVGLGHVGREVAHRAAAFSMKVWAVRKNPQLRETTSLNLEFVGALADLPLLLSAADYLVLTCPLTAETEGLIGERELASMKPSAFLVNVSRGRIVQEKALYEALQTRRIAGAALDVWYRYPSPGESTCPPSTFPFRELQNVIMTPHTSGCTHETFRDRWNDIARNIDGIAKGEPPLNVVYVGSG